MKVYSSLLVAGLMSFSFSVCAMSLDVQEVGYNIEAKGANAVVAELARQGQLKAIADNIQRGDDSWIILAPKLAGAGNSSFSEQVKNALSLALFYNPAAVIHSVSQSRELSLDDICRSPRNTDKTSFQQRAERVLMTIKNRDLLSNRDTCINFLKQ